MFVNYDQKSTKSDNIVQEIVGVVEFGCWFCGFIIFYLIINVRLFNET